MHICRCFALAAALVGAATLARPVHHDELIDGDLSSDIGAPTDLGLLGLGMSVISGTASNALNSPPPAPPMDIDVFTFTVGAGEAWSALMQISYDGNGDPGVDLGFAAFVGGSTFPFTPRQLSGLDPGFDPLVLLGGLHIGDLNGDLDNSNDAGDVLPLFVTGANLGIPIGGSPIPLGPGQYTFFVQQLGNSPFDYELGFVITPAPSSAFAMLAGAALLARRRRA